MGGNDDSVELITNESGLDGPVDKWHSRHESNVLARDALVPSARGNDRKRTGLQSHGRTD